MRLAVAWGMLLGCQPASRVAVAAAAAAPAPPAFPIASLWDRIAGGAAAVRASPRLDEVAGVAARTASASAVVSARAVQAAMATAVGSGAWPHVLTGWGE